ncbi:hypothetical protein HPP92_025757 [Vanilla planifolia]|uniref:Protein kinase domain-containing protein n=1 Tax=Vanilla planifolia TaxID=51239 RepID=A0A835PKP9_VANPL|nr:hypothetical protein HPP92_025757 [Vanilla planifolia]
MSLSTFVLLLFFTELATRPCEAVLQEEVSALEAFKREISVDPLARLSDWSASRHPCNWFGIKCSDSNRRVISINFSNSSLKGFLAPELGSLNSLQELVLDNNQFYGSIQKEIGMLKGLQLLNLSVNLLSGPIPSEIGDLTAIKTINLQFNGLTGDIPPELGNLFDLIELRLDRNKLTGDIPGSSSSNKPATSGMSVSHSNITGLCQLTALKIADFSYNFLQGNIPTCLHLPGSSFQGNCFQDKTNISRRSAQQCISAKNQGFAEGYYEQSSSSTNHRNLKEPLWLLILEIVTGSLILIFLLICILYASKRCNHKPNIKIPWKQTPTTKHQRSISADDELLKNVWRYSKQELDVACEDFSNIIGSSSDSLVYKGTVKDGSEIAVISLSVSISHWTSYLELCFKKEVENLARLNNENTSKFLGFCQENEPFSRMFVFEYASNGTLYEHLHYGDETQLSWLRRMKVAIGVARGLRYLHTEVVPPFTVSKLNSNAIYLTEDFTPKLVDFERWNAIVSKLGDGVGYLTNGSLYSCLLEMPEKRNMDVQGNTYEFGLLLLELISGRPQYCKDRGSIVNWASDYLQHPENISMLVDPQLKNVSSEDLSVLLSVISLCIEPEPAKRPSMQELCSMLEDGIDASVRAVFKESSLGWGELEFLV